MVYVSFCNIVFTFHLPQNFKLSCSLTLLNRNTKPVHIFSLGYSLNPVSIYLTIAGQFSFQHHPKYSACVETTEMCGMRYDWTIYTHTKKGVIQYSSYSKKWSLSADSKKFYILQHWGVVH